MSELLTCPLCGADGFLRRGLSSHLGNRHCVRNQQAEPKSIVVDRDLLNADAISRWVTRAQETASRKERKGATKP